MKTKKNNTKKEQITAQVENQEIVANATEVTNPTSSQEENSIKEDLEAIASGKKNKKSKKDKKSKYPHEGISSECSVADRHNGCNTIFHSHKFSPFVNLFL